MARPQGISTLSPPVNRRREKNGNKIRGAALRQKLFGEGGHRKRLKASLRGAVRWQHVGKERERVGCHHPLEGEHTVNSDAYQ